jgi:hypothetical protein
MATTTRTDGERTRTRGESRDLIGGARTVAENVGAAAGTVAGVLPEAAATTRAAVDQAARQIEAGSDEMLTIGTAFSLGLSLGMLIGGAPRLLVMGGLVPTAAMGLTLLDRAQQRRGSQ